jgi:serine/threonine-protein kinase
MTSADASDSLIGRRFYDYRIAKKLAQGGMGAVYLVSHESLPNIRKVLKVVLPEYAQDPAIRDRFHREAEAVSQLVHPNIVGIDSVGTLDDGQLCMLIPFLEGQPLNEFVREHGRRLPPHCVLHIATHIARALDYAHRRGIVHRDLKPANVFIEPTDDDPYFAKVLDFGIAKQMNPSTDRASATLAGPLGTPSYMAVEQYEHAAEATPAADVYALAIMIWEMVTGRLPWGVQDVRVLYHKQLIDPPDPPAGDAMPSAWEAVLRSALVADPRERPQSMRQFLQALASVLPGVPPDVPSGVGILQGAGRTLGGLSGSGEGTPVGDVPGGAPDSTWPLAASFPEILMQRAPESTWPLRTFDPQGVPPANARAPSQAEPAADSPATSVERRRGALSKPGGASEQAPPAADATVRPAAGAEAMRGTSSGAGAGEAVLAAGADTWTSAPSAPGAEALPAPGHPRRWARRWASRSGTPRAIARAIPSAWRIAVVGVLVAGGFVLWRGKADRAAPGWPPGRDMVRFTAVTVQPGIFDTSRRPAICAKLDEAEDCAASAAPEQVTPVRVAAFDLDVREVSNGELAAWLSSIATRWTADSYGRIALQQGGIPLVLASDDCFGALAVTSVGRVVARPDKARWPAICVTWYGANEYCRAQHKRLPLAAEWELATKGQDGRPFPWGNDLPTPDGVTFDLRDAGDAHPRDVGSSPKDISPEGVRDLGGNVAEWVEDDRGRAATDLATGTATEIIRGGSWGSRGPCHLLGSGCKRIAAAKYSKDVGFRCASSADNGKSPEEHQ